MSKHTEISLNPALLLPVTTVSGSTVPSSCPPLQGPQSSVPTFLSQFYSTQWDKLNQTKPREQENSLT